MISKDTIREFRTAANKAHSNFNFSQFCKVVGCTTDKYGEGQWFAYQTFCQMLSNFDDATMEKILNSGKPK